jgi:hypothetical protein
VSEQTGLPVPMTSIYSCHDNFVAPQDSSVLAGAKNVPLTGIGHLSLLFSERVAALVDAELRQLGTATDRSLDHRDLAGAGDGRSNAR